MAVGRVLGLKAARWIGNSDERLDQNLKPLESILHRVRDSRVCCRVIGDMGM